VSFDLRCHRCSAWIGEARESMELVGLFQKPRDREHIPEPRDAWRCKGCGWVNVFKPAEKPAASWRTVETKG
jgi:hypothetical protein